MDNTKKNKTTENKNTPFIIKIIIAVLCGFAALYATGAIVTIFISAFVTFTLFGEIRKNKTLLCLIFTLAFLGGYIINADKIHVLNFALSALNILLPSLVISVMFDKKRSDLSELVKAGTLANIAVTILELAKIKFIDKINLVDEYITPAFENAKNTYAEVIINNAEALPDNFSETFNQVYTYAQDYLVRFIPFILIISSVFASFVLIKLSAFLIAKITLKTSPYKLASPFEQYCAPHHNGFLMIALFIVIIAMEVNSFSLACYNLIAFIFTEYVICGIAIVFYIVSKRINAKGIFKYFMFFVSSMLILIVSALMSFIGGLNILVLMGMFDSTFNFRKLAKRKKDKFV